MYFLYLIALHACTILGLYLVPFAFLLITSCTLVYYRTLFVIFAFPLFNGRQCQDSLYLSHLA